MKVTWYKRLFCGYNPLGSFADVACKGTEMERELTIRERKANKVVVRCWCCTFWRGVLLGSLITASVIGVYHAIA